MTAPALIIKWLGHACFLLTTMAGTNIVIDPFGANVGYKMPDVGSDMVFVSHMHFDHNAVGEIKGSPVVVNPLSNEAKPRVASIKIGRDTVRFMSMMTYHDASRGKERGSNTVNVINADGIRVCHLGDLGHVLTESQVKAISPVDVLMVPVGGDYTIDGKQAQKVVQQLDPKIVIPMHYKTPALRIDLQPVDGFLKGFDRVVHADKIILTKDSLPKETTVYVLKY